MSRAARLLAACLALPTVAWAGGPVRIALREAADHVEVAARDGLVVRDLPGRRPLLTVPPSASVRIAPRGRGLGVGMRRLEGEAVRLESRGGALGLDGREYLGALEVFRQGPTLLVVNELDLEEYVAGTLRGEAPEGWPMESLKALAVAARTYAVYHRQKNAGRPFHLLAGTQSQVYLGRVPNGSPIWAAVRETPGEVLTWRGTVFLSFYHAESGGWTEPPQAVFAGEFPPLPGVLNEFSRSSPHYTWTLTLPLAGLRELLRKGGLDPGEITALEVLERSPSGRAVQLAIRGSRGPVVLRGTDFRRLVGNDTLKSTLFAAIVSDGRVRFEGRGWGHGVGLSQWGAKAMAEHGSSYRQILEFYYPGARLARGE